MQGIEKSTGDQSAAAAHSCSTKSWTLRRIKVTLVSIVLQLSTAASASALIHCSDPALLSLYPSFTLPHGLIIPSTVTQLVTAAAFSPIASACSSCWALLLRAELQAGSHVGEELG